MWEVSVVETDSVPEIRVAYGKLGGKVIEKNQKVTKGKNIGKANETTPTQQAIKDAESLWTSQLERNHYGLTVEESLQKKLHAPMLAHVYADYKSRIEWHNARVQPKFNGHRCVAKKHSDGFVTLTSREGVNITSLHRLLEDLEAALNAGETVDGELYLHGTSLQQISSFIKKRQDVSDNIQFYIYDLFSELPFARRWAYAEERIKFSGVVRKTPTFLVKDEEQLFKFQAKAISEGYEGAMLRHSDSPYEPGKRSKSLLKVKTFLDDEFEIVGVKEGEKTFEGMAIFICDSKRGGTFDVTSPGTHDEKREAWKNKDSFIGKMLTVKYAEYTQTESPKPFHPVALQIRENL